MQISIKQLQKIFGKKVDILFLLELQRCIRDFAEIFNINEPMHLVRFLAQVKHELGFYKDGRPRIRENLNYKPKQLIRFSKRFRSNPTLLDKAMSLKGKQKQKFIAMEWYGKGKKAKVLGNKKPIDGWRYRGSGVFQITGRYNHFKVYKHIEKKLNIVCFNKKGEIYKELLNSYFGAIVSGMAFWDLTKMWECHNSLCVINKINRGLPKKEKRERIATATKIKRILNV
jgi:predicted chitinase